MEFQRVKRSGPFSLTVQLQHDAPPWDADADSDPDLDFTGPVTGELRLSLEHDTAFEYPIDFIFSAHGEYLSFDTVTRSITDTSEFPVTVRFKTHAANLRVLITLFEEYRDGSARDPDGVRRAFEAADVSVTPEKYTLQYDTEYTTGYSLLLSRQRSKELGLDAGENTEFFQLIEDAITPTGLSETETMATESASDGGVQSERTDSTPPSTSRSTSTSPSTAGTVDGEYTETARLQRDPEFLQTVREAYNERCAVCGTRRETPDGRPEVEAAHIKSVSDGGGGCVRKRAGVVSVASLGVR